MVSLILVTIPVAIHLIETSLILNGSPSGSPSGSQEDEASSSNKKGSDQNGDSNGLTEVNSNDGDSLDPKTKGSGSTGSTTLTDSQNGKQANGKMNSSGDTTNSQTPLRSDETLITDVGFQYQYSQVLLGTLMAYADVLQDEQGYPTIFYVFNDLSIRSSGRYRLKFHLFQLPSETQTFHHADLIAISNIFTVHSPRTFPGMTDSTELTKCLARQGVRLHVRSGDMGSQNGF
jgi:hypothetical protein